METRVLGASGLKVPALGFGVGTFGGKGHLFSAWGNTDATAAKRLLDICLDAGVNLFDTADVYSDGESERVLGAAIESRRDRILLSTKTALRTGHDPNDVGLSRIRLLRAVDASLQRLGTDHIDLLQLHAFDASTPLQETLDTLDDLIKSGKLRYFGISNFSSWQLARTVAVSEQQGVARPIAHQVYYSLVGRDYEWERMPAGQALNPAQWCGARWDGGD